MQGCNIPFFFFFVFIQVQPTVSLEVLRFEYFSNNFIIVSHLKLSNFFSRVSAGLSVASFFPGKET